MQTLKPAVPMPLDGGAPATLLEAESLEGSDPQAALAQYTRLIQGTATDADAIKNRETAVLRASEILKRRGDAAEFATYIRSLEGAWTTLPRAKSARLIRALLDGLDSLATGAQRAAVKELEMKLCLELVEWTVRDKRAFLKQTLEQRLAALYLDNKLFSEALALVTQLLRELKRMEDKLTLVEVHLLECRIYFQLRNGPKAKAALTAARSNANAIYCPPLVQAALDMQSALVYADEGDFKTASSYFIEAMDSYASQEDARGATALKYLLLCKIMLGQSEDLDAVAGGKIAQRYSIGAEVEAMKAVGQAHRNKSLQEFEAALAKHPEQLGTDMLVHAHFQALYDQLLQQNLLQIIAPYAKVQLQFVASSIGLPVSVVESKLSLMILDKQLNAIIDQHDQCLLINEEPVHDSTFALALEMVKHLDSAVDALYQKATALP